MGVTRGCPSMAAYLLQINSGTGKGSRPRLASCQGGARSYASGSHAASNGSQAELRRSWRRVDWRGSCSASEVAERPRCTHALLSASGQLSQRGAAPALGHCVVIFPAFGCLAGRGCQNGRRPLTARVSVVAALPGCTFGLVDEQLRDVLGVSSPDAHVEFET
jgi:hypothetical protein